MPPSVCATPGSARTLREQRFGQRWSHVRAAPFFAVADRALAGDYDVGVLVDLREHGAERGFDRVGEDVGAADHRHAEHDRQGGQRRAELAAGETFERDRDHAERLPITVSTSAALAPVSSLTINPSAMNRMRSAIAAARGSWVTITVVWP